MDEKEFMLNLLADFRLESEELILRIDQGFSELNNQASEGKVRAILQDLHSLKGSAQAVDQEEIAEKVHKLEDKFEEFGDDDISRCLEELDSISDMIENLFKGLSK